MPSRESYTLSKAEKSLVHKSKQEGKEQELLAAALTMRMRPQKPPATLWQPLKLFAYSQLSSLVRRATLKDNDRVPKYEKVHNFKVRQVWVLCFVDLQLLHVCVCWRCSVLYYELFFCNYRFCNYCVLYGRKDQLYKCF